MSLFPAYETKSENEIQSTSKGDQKAEESNWLSNSSFQSEILLSYDKQSQYSSSDSSDCQLIEVPKVSKDNEEKFKTTDVKLKKAKKKSKSKKRKKDKKLNYETVVEKLYFEDKFRDKMNLKVDTLNPRIRPAYNFSDKFLGFRKIQQKSRMSCKRYFASDLGHPKAKRRHVLGEKKSYIKENEEVKEEESFDTNKLIQERLTQIKNYNEQLTDDPNNVDLWIEYINNENNDNEFDDKEAKNKNIKYDRKLSIVEKALEKNSNNKKLLKLKYKIMKELIPIDEYLNKIETLKSKMKVNKSNDETVLLWKILISSSRTSVCVFTYTNVVNLYTKFFENLNLWPKININYYDNNLLKNLYKCIIFIRQCGFWEQMCEIIRMNMNLNLNTSINIDKNKINGIYFKGSMDEKKLIELEEVILTSQLPLNQLWLRVELLRENSHWISVNRDQLEYISDSHRFITPDDVVNFVHPLLSKKSNFSLAVYVILSLKVPLIPVRHTLLHELFNDDDDDDDDDNNWMFDSIESILPMIYPSTGINSKSKVDLSIGFIQSGLTSGPQYLRYHPAQEYYLDYVRDIFYNISESMTANDKIAMNIWWLKFERMLLSINKNEKVKLDKNNKKLKGILKEFLKRPDNRNNLYYYREYALIEKEMGQFNNSINILETAIKINDNNLTQLIDINEKSALISLYRSLIETLLDLDYWKESNRDKILLLFSQMTGGKAQDSFEVTEKYLYDCYQYFVNDFQSLSLPTEFSCQYFLPNFYCDAVMCYVYYLYIRNSSVEQILEIFNGCLKASETNYFINEYLTENKIIFIQYVYEKSQILSFREHLSEALVNYPDNFYLLSVYAGLESTAPNWKVNTNWNGSNRLWPSIAHCLAIRARLNSPLICSSDETAKRGVINKLLSLHQRLSTNEDTKSCPLVWRLYMLLLREHEDICKKVGEKIYHDCLSQCPWARCVYIDAAEIAPQFLTQIQDIIREKNLRIHVTPEELDILRG